MNYPGNLTIDEQIEKLKEELEKKKQEAKEKDEALKQQQQALDAAQKEQKALEEQMAALSSIDSDIDKVKEQVHKLADNLKVEMVQIRKDCNDVTTGLNNQLKPDYMADVGQVRAEVDMNIQQLQAKAQDEKTNLHTAEAAAEQARKASKDADAAFSTAQTSLRSLPADILAGKAEVTRLRTAMCNAYDKDLLKEALLQALDLEQGLSSLDGLLHEDTIKQRIDRLDKCWRESIMAKQEALQAAANLEAQKAKTSKAEKDAQDATNKRKTTIDEKVDALGQPGLLNPAPGKP